MEVLGGGSLQISNLTEEDAGVYTCMADNANATIEAQAQLTLQGNPRRFALSASFCTTSDTNWDPQRKRFMEAQNHNSATAFKIGLS